MSDPMPVSERVKKASAARVENARTLRHQRALAAMRADGLTVHVTRLVPDEGYRLVPEYTEEGVAAAIAARVKRAGEHR